jgi:hypothetical protein
MADDFVMGDDELGAIVRASRRAAASYAGRRAMPVARLMSKIPGAPAVGLRQYPLGFGVFTFTAASGTATTVTATPQRPFKGRRLVIDIARTGATATGLVSITSLLVGQNNQLVSAQALPAAAFGPTSFGVDLDLDPATPGILLVLALSISVAPGGADTVAVSPAIIGDAIG